MRSLGQLASLLVRTSLSRIFVVCFAAGIAGGYVLLARSTPAPKAPLAAPEPRSAKIDAAEGQPSAPLIATREPTPAPPAPPQPAAPRPPLPAPVEPTPLERERSKADELAAAEPLKPEDVRTLLEQVLAGKLPRELSARDYDRLTDAVMRVRAAERILRGIDETPDSAELRAEQREVLTGALSEAEDITGLKLPELSKVVDPNGGLTEEQNDEGLGEPPSQ